LLFVNHFFKKQFFTMISLNVGGIFFVTSRETLQNTNSGFFHSLVTNSPSEQTDFFIDRDPQTFRYILNYLRGVRHLPSDVDTLKDLLQESEFYLLPALSSSIRQAIRESPPSTEQSLVNIAIALGGSQTK